MISDNGHGHIEAPFYRDPPEPTGDEPEDFEYEAPKIYEPVSIRLDLGGHATCG